MKRFISIIAALCIVTLLNAQSGALDDFFEKYSGRDGYTTVTISGKLLGLFTDKNVDAEGSKVINRLSSIRILSVEDSVLNQSINFYKELAGKMDLSSYEELMDVREGRETTKFLIKQKGDIVTELLMVTGGPGNNAVICIRGELDLKSLSELSEETGLDQLKDLEKADKKKQDE